MENKITKNLIILGAIVFSLAFANYTFAASDSSYTYYQQSGYNTNPYYNYQGYSPSTYYSSYYPQSTVNSPIPVPTNPINPYNLYSNQVSPQYNSYYQTSGYSTNNDNSSNTVAKTEPSVVNNYYYQTAPTKVATVTNPVPVPKTTTNTTSTTTNYANGTDTNAYPYNYSNNLGASAYTGSGITALTLRGSGSFMPSSIWQWLIVIFLILIIIVISRMFIHKPTPQEAHTVHTH